jgi:hypothetical protein
MIVIQNELLFHCFIPHVEWTFRSFSLAEKSWQNVDVKVSLLLGRESDIFREKKIQKERNIFEEPNDKRTPHGEVISHILFKCEKWVIKNLFSEKFPLISEMLTFFELHWSSSSSAAGSAKFEKNQGVLSSKHSCNKR